MRAHQLHPTLVVMPRSRSRAASTRRGERGPGQPQVETWLTRDVPDWVGQHFRVIPNRNAWATIGYSAGGFVAAMATVLHPAQYGAGIVLGGYFRPEFGPFYEPFTATSPLGRYYDLPRVAAHRPPPVSLWVETSHADPLSYTSSASVPARHPGPDGRARRGPAERRPPGLGLDRPAPGRVAVARLQRPRFPPVRRAPASVEISAPARCDESLRSRAYALPTSSAGNDRRRRTALP